MKTFEFERVVYARERGHIVARNAEEARELLSVIDPEAVYDVMDSELFDVLEVTDLEQVHGFANEEDEDEETHHHYLQEEFEEDFSSPQEDIRDIFPGLDISDLAD